MTEVLFNPSGFFGRLAQREARIWPAYAVYLLAVLLSALGSQLALRSLPSPLAIGNPWLWAVVGSLVAALAMWGIFGFLVMLASGTGARAFEVVGWAAAPGVVTGLLLLAAGALFPVQGVVPPAPSDPAQLAEWMKAYQAVAQSGVFTQVSRALGLVMLIWSAWIVYTGVGVFARSRAALAAGVYLALQLGMYFLGSVRLGG